MAMDGYIGLFYIDDDTKFLPYLDLLRNSIYECASIETFERTTGVSVGAGLVDTVNSLLKFSNVPLNWTRSGTTATVTETAHGRSNGSTINVLLSSDTGAIVIGTKTITVVDANTYTFTCLNAGAASGTVSLSQIFKSTNLVGSADASYNTDCVFFCKIQSGSPTIKISGNNGSTWTTVSNNSQVFSPSTPSPTSTWIVQIESTSVTDVVESFAVIFSRKSKFRIVIDAQS